jgi:hypothetical protein
VIVCGTGKQSEALCKVQSLFFLKKVSFSQVVLTIQPRGISSLNNSWWRPLRQALGHLGIATIQDEPTRVEK